MSVCLTCKPPRRLYAGTDSLCKKECQCEDHHRAAGHRIDAADAALTPLDDTYPHPREDGGIDS